MPDCSCAPVNMHYHPTPLPPADPSEGCPECPEASAWEGDPFTGNSFAAKFTRSGAGNNYLTMAGDAVLPAQFLPGTDSFTIGCFVKFSEIVATSDIVTRFAGGAGEQFVLGYTGNKFYFVIRDTAGVDSTVLYSPLPTPAVVGVWYSLAASYDKILGKLRIWVDAVQTNVDHATGLKAGNMAGIVVGGRGGAGTTFAGLIEGLWVHRGTVWSDAAIVVWHNAGIGVRWERFMHFNLPIPSVFFEFEDGGNVGKNYAGDPAYDLVNSNSPDGLAGLVTLDIGLPYDS